MYFPELVFIAVKIIFMGTRYQSISKQYQEFIKRQKIFFVGTAAAKGRVNVSPKGMDTFRVLDEHTVLWMNLTGSGNETAAHLQQNDRMTIMFCSFDRKPIILRLYGHASMYHPVDEEYAKYEDYFTDFIGARQIIKLQVDLVQKSCGYAVPLMEFQEERKVLDLWSAEKGREGIQEYWKEKNLKSIDGFATGMKE